MSVIIVGKGPSLDNLSSKYFYAGDVVLAINDSVYKVAALEIPSISLHSIQMDYELGELIGDWHKIASRRCEEQGLYWGKNATYYDYKCDITLEFAILVAKNVFQADHIDLLCFDAIVNGNCEYAKCIGYESDTGPCAVGFSLAKDRFLYHKVIAETALRNTSHSWIIPEG